MVFLYQDRVVTMAKLHKLNLELLPHSTFSSVWTPASIKLFTKPKNLLQ